MASIITLALAKQQLNIDADDTSLDEELQRYVDGVTDAVEDYKGLIIAPRTVTDEIDLDWTTTSFLLRSTPVISLTSLTTVDGSMTWDVSNLHVNTDTGRVTVLAGPPVSGLVAATVQAGMDPVPTRYVQGALVILQHAWETQRGQGGITSGVIGPEETYDPRMSYSIPRKALEWLGNAIPGVA